MQCFLHPCMQYGFHRIKSNIASKFENKAWLKYKNWKFFIFSLVCSSFGQVCFSMLSKCNLSIQKCKKCTKKHDFFQLKGNSFYQMFRISFFKLNESFTITFVDFFCWFWKKCTENFWRKTAWKMREYCGPCSWRRSESKEDENQFTLSWQDLSYHVGTEQSRHQILYSLNGYVEPGQALVIMGPSGCGKTTLLNLLADRVSTGITSGNMYANGKPRDDVTSSS